MKKEESRNIIAPMLNITLSTNGSPALNLRTVRLSPASVPGRDAMIMGSVNLSFSSALTYSSPFYLVGPLSQPLIPLSCTTTYTGSSS